MHKTKFIFTLLVALTFLSADRIQAEPVDDLIEFSKEEAVEAEDELSRIDVLIRATEENLARQKGLRGLIDEYRTTEKACIANPKDSALLFKLARTGKAVYENINDAYLADYFQPEFLTELQKLKQIADKKSIPPVR